MQIILLCLFFLTCTFQLHPKAHDSNKRVTIIGAGLAGLTAAHRLQKMGYETEIYEARSRPGGRVLTAYFEDGSYDELGGKNVYDGGDGESILALIEELGLDTEKREYPGTKTVIFNGKTYDGKEIFKDAPEPSEANLTALRQKIKSVRSLGDLIDPFLGVNTVLRAFMELSMKCWEGNSSYFLAPEYIDHSFWDIYTRYYSPGPRLITIRSVKGGNSLLVEALAKPLEGHIHYDYPLRQITRDADQKIWLHFDGESVSTDYLILALPCSTLRDVAIQKGLFPEDQMSAIDTLQYGTNAKILFPIALKGELPPGMFVMDHWISFFNVGSTILTAYISGDEGIFDAYCTECMTDVIKREMPAFRKATPMITFSEGLIPTSPKDQMFASYKKPVAISWTLEEFSRGSYSNFGVGTYGFFNELIEEHGEQVRRVFRSVDNAIFFAGEHTAPLEDNGTMDGAVYSGERAARMLDRVMNDPA